MREAWKAWEGRVVNKEFRLGDYLGGSESAGVFAAEFGPGSRNAVVKLIPVSGWEPGAVEGELARLKSARELKHPHVTEIFQTCRTTVDETEMISAVMEQADEDLSQILPNRALAEGEVRELLPPILEALAYLHGKGFAHGRMKPANVMAVGDQLKLSGDGLVAIGTPRGMRGETEYDAPELAAGQISQASDVWSLGMLLVAALTQRVPSWDANGDPILPENLPAPFDEIARNCLRRDPRARWGIAEIAARAGVAIPALAATAASEGERVASTPARGAGARAGDTESSQRAARPQVVTSRPRPAAVGPSRIEKRNSPMGLYVTVAGALVIALVIFVPRLFRSSAARPGAQLTQRAQKQTARKDSATAAKTKSRPPRAENGEIAREKAVPAKAQEIAENEAAPSLSIARETTSRRDLTAGHPSDQVIPEVPQSARKTIHGTVRVGVRVSVDSSGSVTEAELDSPGPSKYFAQVALDAAQQWKFDPPKTQGRNVLSDWLLQFQFTQMGTKVIPTQSDP